MLTRLRECLTRSVSATDEVEEDADLCSEALTPILHGRLPREDLHCNTTARGPERVGAPSR